MLPVIPIKDNIYSKALSSIIGFKTILRSVVAYSPKLLSHVGFVACTKDMASNIHVQLPSESGTLSCVSVSRSSKCNSVLLFVFLSVPSAYAKEKELETFHG